MFGQRLGAALGATLAVDEVKAAAHGPGGCFPAHFDTTATTGRVVTAILYLSEAWAPGDGGELRVYPPGGGAPVDVAPRRNALVVFSSTSVLHRTLPLVRGLRTAVSFWFSSTEPIARLETPRRHLVKLAHADDYAQSFRDAFPADDALAKALAGDAAANAAAEAALDDAGRAELERLRRRR